MTNVVETCLMENNTTFIQLLVDAGFPLHDYVQDELIAKLYMRDFKGDVRYCQTQTAANGDASDKLNLVFLDFRSPGCNYSGITFSTFSNS